MKRVLIILCVCLATALCAWAAWPQQEARNHDHHDCIESTHECCDAEAISAAGTWVKVSDSCGKCKMNDTDRICGKCGGFMESVDGTGSYEGGYLKYDYKCKKCGHTITCKNK